MDLKIATSFKGRVFVRDVGVRALTLKFVAQ
jgi:hypothetical protein